MEWQRSVSFRPGCREGDKVAIHPVNGGPTPNETKIDRRIDLMIGLANFFTRVVTFPKIIFISPFELYHTGGMVFFGAEYPAGADEMIAKVDDKYVTAEIVEDMTAKEYKAFENRLRSVARKHGYKINKYVHPINGDTYSVVDVEINKLENYDLDIFELRDYLYEI